MEEGQEVRPHHYIRSILPGGPVGRERTLQPGDELLQVGQGSALKVAVQYHIIVGGDPLSGRCVTRAFVLIGCSLAQLPFGRLSATLELSYRVTHPKGRKLLLT